MAYGIHVGGVIYTLGVNDRGSHLCLGVIYASDNSDRSAVRAEDE